MSISDLRRDVDTLARDFAWGQWSQMGILAASPREDRWAADPEALLLFTLEAGRNDPRLFDEVLDWLLTNERLVSVQRLRNLCVDDEDRALVDASLGWVVRWRPRARLRPKEPPADALQRDVQALFRTATYFEAGSSDPAFLDAGFAKAEVDPSGKSQRPDPSRPINFAFRMRLLLGLGARAEVIRSLLTIEAPRLSAQVIAESAAFAKRNVQDALTSLREAGVVDAVTVANEQRYGIPRERWAELLALPSTGLPVHRDWPQILSSLRQILRWLHDPRLDDLSDYLLASEARVLEERVSPGLRYAGVPTYRGSGRGAAYWLDFEQTVRSAFLALESEFVPWSQPAG